ncbi:senescence-specific cysteine protease SAG12-like [Diospyros lotus]|uniref:senescence-specific cysteine protease SAG12-like n=1 Tax=Diospyros lotus TaxID=55363 RepID=UPI0022577F2F|nr:senescence-specific cysteine protease SAG12-like isoform X1 [Diospyros lotus]XP_052179422.1 senescence-specific cysteine protease SAG12-like isoform X2 [Diospyros lotus]XP_052179804.1 senescence-specific cysteine protease SAG12-like [Diospyros lotus]
MARATTHLHLVIFSFTFLFAFELIIVSAHGLEEAAMLEQHEQWMARHGRIYKDSTEKATRFKIFKKNVEYIDAFNVEANKKYNLSVNKFADMTDEEFIASYTGYKATTKEVMLSSFSYANVNDVPSTIDWREKGAVTDVKNQMKCGCCWAFSAVAALEGINQMKTGQLVSLSEQELVDCDYQNHGCEGGSMETAFQFITQNNGLATEADYPYQGGAGTCDGEKRASPVAAITSYEQVPMNDEAALLQAVANQPVSVAVSAGQWSDLRFYNGGVFTGPCTTNLDHAVTAIGYGTSEDGTKFWLIKNSWGTEWGENGYLRIQRDVDEKEGLCGIAMKPSYPVIM